MSDIFRINAVMPLSVMIWLALPVNQHVLWALKPGVMWPISVEVNMKKLIELSEKQIPSPQSVLGYAIIPVKNGVAWEQQAVIRLRSVH